MIEEKNYAKDYCPAEIMAAFMCRTLVGFVNSGVGAASIVPLVAIRLAQETVNPDLFFRIGPAGCTNSKYNRLARYMGDFRFQEGSEARFQLEYVMDSFGDPRVSKGHLSYRGGFQIDKYGNINMIAIGDPKKPKFRGPGTVGLMSAGLGGGLTDIFTYYHTPRLYVEKVDFISGPGFGDGPGWRERMGCPPGGGPRYVITPICIFDFDEETKVMRLKSVHPGHTIEEILKRTGFKPIIPENVPETELPTVEEVAFMRSMDPDGLLPKITED